MGCYKAYSAYCSNPHLVHNIHLGSEPLITSGALQDRLSVEQDRPLRLAYAGRVHREKGVYDWIEVLSLVAKAGYRFDATWFGGGPELSAVRKRVRELDLSDSVSFPGPIGHAELLGGLKSFDAFMFCHKTVESPRCLIEALRCGLPIVGYDTAYSKDLIHNYGGGLLTSPDDVVQLSKSLILISKNWTLLRSLSESAIRDGEPFTDETVFRHRADLIKSMPISAPNLADH